MFQLFLSVCCLAKPAIKETCRRTIFGELYKSELQVLPLRNEMIQIGPMLNRKVEVNALFRFLSGIRKSSSFGNVSRVVYQSLSHDIFTNLALEDWFYRNWNFDDKHLLLLWRNKPSVVIGRHQNAWTAANLH